MWTNLLAEFQLGCRLNLSTVGIAGLLVIVTVLSITLPAYAAAVTITPSSADTHIDSDSPFSNAGAIVTMNVRSGAIGNVHRILVKFDLSSIPAGSAINIAYLQLYYNSWVFSDPVGRTYTVYQVTTNWVEGTTSSCTAGATWNKPDCSAAPTWTTAGGDFTATGSASHILIAGDFHNYVTWDVTAIVKAWIETGQNNYGFLVRDPNDGLAGIDAATVFNTRENTAGNLPILKIDYTATVIPEYPLGLPLLAIFMVIGYGLIRRRTSTKES